MKNIISLLVYFLAFFAIPRIGQAEDNTSTPRVVHVDANSWISLEKSSSGLSQQLTFYQLDPIVISNPNPEQVRFDTILLMCESKEGVGSGMEIYKKPGEQSLTGTLMVPPHKLFQTVAEAIVLNTNSSLETKGFVACLGASDNRIVLSLFTRHEPIFSATALIPNKENIPLHTRSKEGFPMKFESDW